METKYGIRKSLHLQSMALLLIWMGSVAPGLGQKLQESPNIILILADDMGWGDLSFQGNKNLHTPNLDQLAKEGITLKNFYVQPVCSPTRAEILTGIHHRELGVRGTSAGGERMSLGVTTLGEHLQKNGYLTALFGKWHNGSQAPYHPNTRGFDHFFGFASGHWPQYFNARLEENGQWVQTKGFLPDILTSKALEYLEANTAAPKFIFLAYNTPHSPMQVPDANWNKIKPDQLKMRSRYREQEDLEFTRAALAMVENLDENLGRILNSVKKLESERATLVLFLSDNGPNSYRWNGGLKGRKGSTDEGGTKSSFIAYWPERLPAAITISSLSGSIDLFPTIAGLIEKPAPEHLALSGRNWSEAWKDGLSPDRPDLLVHHWNRKTSLRSQRFRLGSAGGFFAIDADPGQLNDVREKYPEQYKNHKTALERWLASASELNAGNWPFTLGHPGMPVTYLPARDGQPFGKVRRSNRYPNSSYFTAWESTEDFISWKVEVQNTGIYPVYLYYSCKPENLGVGLSLQAGEAALDFEIHIAHDPPLIGKMQDRIPRIESYTKSFKRIYIGNIPLQKGLQTLKLKASKIPGSAAIDFQQLEFHHPGLD